MNKQVKIFNIKKHTRLRQKLRNELPQPEKRLWKHIRNKKLGVKFRRQHGIGRYIADFYCPDKKLVIELDGDSHYQEQAQAYDSVRDEFMQTLGIRVLRISNHDVMDNIDGVLLHIIHYLDSATD